MKQVGILNFHFSNQNYGAVLQALALQEVIKSIGLSSEHINLIKRPPRNTLLIWNIKKFIKVLLGKDFWVRGRDIFEEFRQEHLNTSDVFFHSVKALENYKFKYHSVVVGSDQVWRPKYLFNFVDAYFLSFVSQPTKKIAYAVSFGVDHWEHCNDIEFTKKIKQYVNDFCAISVREDSGKEICKEQFGVEVEQVLDPTLLIGENFFKNLASCNSSARGGVIYYKLDKTSEFLELIHYVESKLNKTSKDIYYKKINNRLREYIPVHEWLSQILNSDFIVTDSFHCICFSLLFKKEFIYYANESRGLSRVESLFRMLNISGRIVTSLDKERVDLILSNKLDYEKISLKIEKQRKSSKEFLKKNLLRNN